MIPTVVPGLVSVVMLVRNRLEYTRSAISSLARASGDLEFVIVDNASQDGTADYLDELPATCDRPVTVLRFADDRGGAERRNAGAAAARGEFLFFVDNDVVADDPGVVEALAAELAADPAVAAVSPLLLFPGDAGLVQCAGGGSTGDGRIGLVGRGRPVADAHRVRREQTWAPTAALMVRRTSFRRAGGFDVAFDPVSLCEDVDLCCRLGAAGERVVYVGSVAMRHFEGTTLNHVGHDKLRVWKRHMRVLRARWAEVFAAGPRHPAADLDWTPVGKDYRDLARPRVWPLVQAADRGFFTSDRALALPGPEDVRVLAVDCGPATHAALRTVPGVRLVGVADQDPTALLAAVRAHDVPWAMRDAARLLDTVPCEGVVLGSHRPELAVAALGRGLHVLLEPAALSDDAELVEASRSSEGRCAVVRPWADHPELAALGRAVASGRIGVPTRFTARLEHTDGEALSHLLDAVERVLGGTVGTVVTTVAAHRIRATVVVAGVRGAIETTGSAARSRLRVSVFGDGELSVDIGPTTRPYADFVEAARGGLVRWAGLGTAVARLVRWRDEAAASTAAG
ncbi:glycosyltransferase [Actinosynnema sp. NPDC023587]|uniref:glycosyltransferase n=1 Tax=Actinosynnema sp. NPDC023587 TaxID=3154695 RepID=UPI0033F8AD23